MLVECLAYLLCRGCGLKYLGRSRERGSFQRSATWTWRELYIRKFELKCNWDALKFTTSVLPGHTNRVSAIQFDDNYLLSASWDGTAILRNSRTYEYMGSFSGHTDRINAIQFTDTHALTGGDDRVIILHTLRDGHIFRMFGSHGGAVNSLRLVDNVLVSGCADKQIYLWGLHTGDLMRTVHEHKAPVLCVDASSDAIVSGSEDFSVKVCIHLPFLPRLYLLCC